MGMADDVVEPAFRGSVSGVGSGGADVALGGGHRFVTQQVHQDVNADICVGPVRWRKYAEGLAAEHLSRGYCRCRPVGKRAARDTAVFRG